MQTRTMACVGALFLGAAAILATTVSTARPPTSLPGPAAAATGNRFIAMLSGAQEVPPVETDATGIALFSASPNQQSLTFMLIVANIEDVLQAHIHLAPAGENGPVVAWLYPDGPPPQLIEGPVNGILSTGTITADDLVGPLEGESLADLLDAMRTGGAYVNVHTSAHPPGEIRGQIATVGAPGLAGTAD